VTDQTARADGGTGTPLLGRPNRLLAGAPLDRMVTVFLGFGVHTSTGARTPESRKQRPNNQRFAAYARALLQVRQRALSAGCTPAALTAEALFPLKELDHPCCNPHGGLGGRPYSLYAGREIGNLRADAEALVRAAFDAARLVLAGVVHPLPRGCVEREHRQRLFRRDAVSSVDVAFGGRPVVAASGVAAGAAVPGVPGLAARRPVLGRVGDRRDLRAEVSA
jgi:hypothetical protein